MNKEIIKGKWKEIKGQLKQQWGLLTDDEITQINGNYDELEGRLLKLYGYSKEQAAQQIESFLDKHHYTEKQ